MPSLRQRLVMVDGVGPGIGNTTLGRSLTAALPDVDLIHEEGAVFERSEFSEVGAQFRRHIAGEPDVAHPPPSMLERAYARLVETLQTSGAYGVTDWSFVALAEDLDWAQASLADLHEHSRAVRAITAPLDPIVVYLGGDVRVGILRRETERGRAWFGAGGMPDDEWFDFVDERTRVFVEGQERLLGTFAAGEWDLVHVNGELGKAEVLRQALHALR